jgi:hypothetical protein
MFHLIVFKHYNLILCDSCYREFMIELENTQGWECTHHFVIQDFIENKGYVPECLLTEYHNKENNANSL